MVVDRLILLEQRLLSLSLWFYSLAGLVSSVFYFGVLLTAPR